MVANDIGVQYRPQGHASQDLWRWPFDIVVYSTRGPDGPEALTWFP